MKKPQVPKAETHKTSLTTYLNHSLPNEVNICILLGFDLDCACAKSLLSEGVNYLIFVYNERSLRK